ncbi:MAG: glycosyltransferase family 4 protein [Bacteroides sp.]
MKVLHICRDYVGSAVHSELYKKLSDYGVKQVIYCIYRDSEGSLYEKNKFDAINTEFFYRPILKQYHRLLFYLKTWKSIKDIENKVDIKSIDIIHATTLFTDGVIGAYLSKKYKKPLIVAVRNTDYNDFIKHAPHLWFVHRNVIKQASKLVFITERLRDKLITHITVKDLSSVICEKSIIRPNGVNSYWLNNIDINRSNTHNILYIGNFEYNKNVARLIRVVASLRKKYPDIHLNIAGGGGWQHKEVLQLIEENQDLVTYYGKVYDKDKLKLLYKQSSVFSMASFHETFGLVYIEALSQGANVIYSKNEGIDGVFKEKVGVSVNPNSDEELQDAISMLFENKEMFEILPYEKFFNFDWSNIAKEYVTLYNRVISK